MNEERARRVGTNEALFRAVNERIEHLTVRFGAGESSTLEAVCECGDSSCTERIRMELGAYEQLRRDPRLFAVVSGHVADDVETIVEHGDGYDVVRKDEGVPADVAEETDPRS